MDTLTIAAALLAGYDWGGRAACIGAALWPERARGLVSAGGYNIQDIPGSIKPQMPENEFRYWYQYYFHSERGRAGLAHNRRDFCRLLWRLWSSAWDFDEEAYMQTAVSFDNPDFVDVVIHSYRHRFALVAGDPAVEETEQRLTKQPKISVPTIVLDGNADGWSQFAARSSARLCRGGVVACLNKRSKRQQKAVMLIRRLTAASKWTGFFAGGSAPSLNLSIITRKSAIGNPVT
jgi:pimeloyl-ACP methyl ester carboxylesterase